MAGEFNLADRFDGKAVVHHRHIRDGIAVYSAYGRDVDSGEDDPVYRGEFGFFWPASALFEGGHFPLYVRFGKTEGGVRVRLVIAKLSLVDLLKATRIR